MSMQSVVNLDLFGNVIQEKEKVVNVSSVPQRSPFRYPGGKTWLVPTSRKWFRHSSMCDTLIEPFCGGGITGLTAVSEGYFRKVVFSEIDEGVAAVWKTMLNENCGWLISKILTFKPEYDELQAALSKGDKSERDLAFATLLRNRTCHGGILAKGSGVMKNGEKGKGIFSRWCPETLARRIRAIQELSGRIEFHQTDAFKIIQQHIQNPKAAFFIDPPYTVAGHRLYTHHEVDHEMLFDMVARIQGNYLMTYDCVDEVKEMAFRCSLPYMSVPMQTTHLIRKEELLISNDFSWLGQDN